MAVVGFSVTFAGVVSSAFAAGTRAALLTFILPVTVPRTRPTLPRGWRVTRLGRRAAIPASDADVAASRTHEMRVAGCRRLPGASCPAASSHFGRPADHLLRATQRPIKVSMRYVWSSAVHLPPVALTTGSRLLSHSSNNSTGSGPGGRTPAAEELALARARNRTGARLRRRPRPAAPTLSGSSEGTQIGDPRTSWRKLSINSRHRDAPR